jgi:translation initiation factor 1 (eIF-1/SUI1)
MQLKLRIIKSTMAIIGLFLFIGCNTPKEKKNEEPKKIVENIEWNSFQGKTNGKNIVLISGDEEYRSEEGLTQLAKILAERHGFNCTVHYSQDPNNIGVIDANFHGNIPGLEQLKNADLMIILTRFRALSDKQMTYINDYLMAGKPVIGLRTSTHAFQFNTKDSIPSKWMHYSNSFKDESSVWNGGFGRLVLGEKWISHHGHHKHQSTLGIVDENAENHPITSSINSGDLWGPTDVYGVRLPLPDDSQPIILGQVTNRKGDYDENDPFYGMKSTDDEKALTNPQQKKIENINDPMMPVAWIKSYQLPGGKTGKSFTSTIASSTDLMSEGVRRLIVNASYWTMGLEVPEKADVTLVGDYQPTAYGFKKDEYWLKRNLKVIDLK